jgi:hypothetical protein
MTLIRGKDGKFWGEVCGGVYVSKRKSEHFCFKYRGYGIQKDLFDRLIVANVNVIRIETEKGKYVAKINVWKEKGITATLRKEDGEQIFLPLEYMIETTVREKTHRLEDY